MARIEIGTCTGCGACVRVCPTDVLRLAATHPPVAVIAFPDDCQTCYCCEIDCPTGAIHVGPFRRSQVSLWEAP
ncbi:MAG: ferredoxin family protein [Candidatus Schekmanbacteria bacterium]|nr:ferredoxin family protein [Candidatus Schekmanbacteria bacterium]